MITNNTNLIEMELKQKFLSLRFIIFKSRIGYLHLLTWNT